MLDMLHLLTVVSLFAGAWLISRGAAYVARKVLAWHDRHTEAAAAAVDLRIADAKRRETTVAVMRAAIAYAALAVAIGRAADRWPEQAHHAGRRLVRDHPRGLRDPARADGRDRRDDDVRRALVRGR